MMEGKYVAYVGTYTHENSVGIHIYDVDELRGTLTERKVVPINNPSDLIVSHSGKYLYSIADEGVEAFAIQPDGDLIPINKKWIGGMRGCYVELDDEDRYLFVGGYHDGRVSMMRLSEDGGVAEIADGIFHKGLGRGVAERASRPHVHCVKVTPDQKFLCAVDSGLDHVKIYRINYERGRIKLADILRCELDSGPRMIRFSVDGRFAYVLCELKNTVDVYNPKTVQATMGGIARVKLHYTPLPDLIQSLKDIPVYGTFLDGENMYTQKLSSNGLIVMGNEGKGIGKEVEQLINRKLYIPNYPAERETSESLNVAIATAVVCAEFRRQAAWK